MIERANLVGKFQNVAFTRRTLKSVEIGHAIVTITFTCDKFAAAVTDTQTHSWWLEQTRCQLGESIRDACFTRSTDSTGYSEDALVDLTHQSTRKCNNERTTMSSIWERDPSVIECFEERKQVFNTLLPDPDNRISENGISIRRVGDMKTDNRGKKLNWYDSAL